MVQIINIKKISKPLKIHNVISKTIANNPKLQNFYKPSTIQRFCHTVKVLSFDSVHIQYSHQWAFIVKITKENSRLGVLQYMDTVSELRISYHSLRIVFQNITYAFNVSLLKEWILFFIDNLFQKINQPLLLLPDYNE